jgi:hypothetical protein
MSWSGLAHLDCFRLAGNPGAIRMRPLSDTAVFRPVVASVRSHSRSVEPSNRLPRRNPFVPKPALLLVGDASFDAGQATPNVT